MVPEFRRRGLARRYMSDVTAICRNAGIRTLELEVLTENIAALALYESCGFAILDEMIVWSRTIVGNTANAGISTPFHLDAIARISRTPPACWQREPASVAAESPCERLVVGESETPEAYAFVRRRTDRLVLLDIGANARAAAEDLLDAIDAAYAALPARLLNEPARGPVHEALSGRNAWCESARQYRMSLSL